MESPPSDGPPGPDQSPVDEWEATIRQRCKRIREARGLTWAAATAVCGFRNEVPGLIETGGGRAQNLYLGQLVQLCVGYEVTLSDMLAGWPGEATGDPPPVRKEELLPNIDALDWNARQNIRRRRLAAKWGTPKLAHIAWGKKALQSTLSRWESGAYRRLDCRRLWLLAQAFNITIIELIEGKP